ncbi:hypothetical protein EJ08DRAFT_680818 [Tothia fuscella]|uniref:Glyoxalase-like domain-containing protein n=1 Tax=Tothia fuscella TaxID=1048955 RepID=A0A9P4TWV5_9PEZI|nr:hypothetical protein EJ08DRAFT_680818 [Tothia fuscella]
MPAVGLPAIHKPLMATLDHIIILVPYSLLSNPSAFSSAFTIYPGGRHADNLTENVLILLKDDVYLELIAFTPGSESKRKNHWWGNKTEGMIIDWALTSSDVRDVEIVNDKLTPELRYSKPVAGGRTRPDGTDVKWKVTFPSTEVVRGALPFWCHDVTPRENRVPLKGSAKYTDHPSRAVGIKSITLAAPSDDVPRLKNAYSDILGVNEVYNKDARYEYTIKSPVEGFGNPTIAFNTAISTMEVKAVKHNGGPGICELVLRVDGEGQVPQPLEEKIGDGTIRIRFER